MKSRLRLKMSRLRRQFSAVRSTGMAAVSYTHLDVYKRQISIRPIHSFGSSRGMMHFGKRGKLLRKLRNSLVARVEAGGCASP